jgi:hypothetical protein
LLALSHPKRTKNWPNRNSGPWFVHFRWVLDKNLHALVSRILTDTRPELVGMKVSLLRLFSVCALRENFIHYLNLDRQGYLF